MLRTLKNSCSKTVGGDRGTGTVTTHCLINVSNLNVEMSGNDAPVFPGPFLNLNCARGGEAARRVAV